MRLNRPLGAVKVVSVTAVAAAACAMWALPAGAATASAAKYATTTVVSVPATGYTHTNIKLSATEKGPGGNPTGTVTFWIGTRKLCHGSLYRRKTSCEAQFSDPATKTIVAKYSGNALHKPSSGTAVIKITNKPATGKYATITHITKPNPIDTVQAGNPETLTATVTSVGGGAVPTGTVEFLPTNLGPAPYATDIVCNATLVDGTGSCTVDPPVGTWGFTLYQATYLGDATHTGSATPVAEEHKLITPDPTFTTVESPATAAAGSVAITADVVPNTYGGLGYNILAGFSETGGDTVQFAIGGNPVTGCTASALQWNGTTQVNYATCTTTLAAGTYSVVATYSGDEYTNASTSATFSITVS